MPFFLHCNVDYIRVMYCKSDISIVPVTYVLLSELEVPFGCSYNHNSTYRTQLPMNLVDTPEALNEVPH